VTELLERLQGQLAGRYAIEREIGRGGMATVYLAQDLRHHRPVALKVLRPDLAATLGTERFLREIQVAAGLTHPHILSLHDSGEAEGLLYYVMPYIEGESLRDRLAREGRLPVAEALKLGREVAEALEYAHRRGVVHRDIKPENILLSSGHAVVADFGIARAIDAAGGGQITQVGAAVGSPMYMSPEQAEGDPELDGRSDVYSLGCVLYEAVTGKAPFSGSTAQAVMISRFLQTPPPLRALEASLPAGLEAVIGKAMAQEPARRFATAAECSAALSALEAGTDPGLRPEPKTEPPSIAVLPFINLSPDPDNEYFSDGMTEELMNALAKLPGLRVAARTSAFSFKGKERNVKEIGQRLLVRTVLEGSVRKAGNRLRISAQLVDTADGYQIWSETYDRDLKDVFALQDEISRTIAGALKVRLVGREDTTLTDAGTRNLEAYTCYLKGRHSVATRTPDGLKRGMKHFEQAIVLDACYAKAHVGLAECWSLLGFIEFADFSPQETLPNAREAALKALELDATLGEAHTYLGMVALVYEWEWVRSERELRRGIELEPNSPLGHVWFACFLASQGRREEALEQARLAEVLDPLSLSIHLVVVRCLYWARRFDEAITHLLAVLEMDPRFALTYVWLGRTYLAMGRPVDAVAQLELGAESSGRSPYLLGLLGRAYASLGQHPQALQVLDEIRAQGGNPYFSSMVLDGLGEIEAALDSLEEALKSHGGFAFDFGVDPIYDELRDHPRFQRLLDTIGLSSALGETSGRHGPARSEH